MLWLIGIHTSVTHFKMENNLLCVFIQDKGDDP